MADLFAGLKRMCSVAVVTGHICVFGPAMATPDWSLVEMRETLREVSRELVEDPLSRGRSLDAIMADVNWTPRAATPAPVALSDDETPARFGWMDARLALAPIHHIYGAKGFGPITSALGRYGTEAVVIEDGVATLDQ